MSSKIIPECSFWDFRSKKFSLHRSKREKMANSIVKAEKVVCDVDCWTVAGIFT